VSLQPSPIVDHDAARRAFTQRDWRRRGMLAASKKRGICVGSNRDNVVGPSLITSRLVTLRRSADDKRILINNRSDTDLAG
jgi:hypothetical protein